MTPPPHDSQGFWQLLGIQGVPMRPIRHILHAGNGRNESLGAGAEQEIIALIHLNAALHVVLVRHLGLTRDHCHAGGRQPGLDAQHQLAHYFLLAGNDFGQVERGLLHADGILLRMAGCVIDLSRIEQSLGRNATLVEADAAQGTFLEQYNTQSRPCGGFGGRISRRTSADDGYLIFHDSVDFVDSVNFGRKLRI